MQALMMAYESRGKPQNVIFHSDQGTHYTSIKFRVSVWRSTPSECLHSKVTVVQDHNRFDLIDRDNGQCNRKVLSRSL